MNHHSALAKRALRVLTALLLGLAAALPATAASALDKVRDSGKMTFGYRADARPFAYSDSGKPAGYAVALCERIGAAMKAELKLPELKIEYQPVTAANRFEQLEQGAIDLSCGTDTPTLERRASVDFSLPIFLSGVGAAMRIDGDRRVRDALSNRAGSAQPVWRGNPGDFGTDVVIAVVGGTTIEQAALERLQQRRVHVTVKSVPDYAAGMQMVIDRQAVALFGDRPVLLDAARRAPAAGQVLVLERVFTREPIALAMKRGDDALRLLVDRTLSHLYRSPEMATLYTTWFGAPGVGALEFFQSVALPD